MTRNHARGRLRSIFAGISRAVTGTRGVVRYATAVGAVIAIAWPALPVQSAPRSTSIVVDGTVCTLAEAIASANADDAGGNGCADGSGADVIDLQTDVLLPAPLPAAASLIFILGNNHTIDGDGSFRTLEISPTGELSIEDAVLTGGSSGQGGGIYNAGILTLVATSVIGNAADEGGGLYNAPGSAAVITDSDFDSNTANEGGGIFNLGYLSVVNSSFSFNESFGDFEDKGGGGISNQAGGMVDITESSFAENFGASGGAVWNAGEMEIWESTITGNISYDEFFGSGGGIRNSGSVTVTQSTIDGNSAFDGGGISSDGTLVLLQSTVSNNQVDYSGGGIKILGGTAVLANSTISGNQALVFHGGGLYAGDGVVSLHNLTITNNQAFEFGGGIYNSSGDGMHLIRSLVSGNTAGEDGTEIFNAGSLTADQYNVFGFSNLSGVAGFAPGSTDIVPEVPIAEVLSHALAFNGGPTRSHALPPGSPAVDTAPSGDCAAWPVPGVDQRGGPRNQDGDGFPGEMECDTGAYEYDPRPFRIHLPLVRRDG